MNFFVQNAWEIFFGLVSAGALGMCKHFWSKSKKLEEMQKADQNRQYRQMILDEIEPIINELTRLKTEISSIQVDVKAALEKLGETESEEHKKMYEDLHKIQKENEKNFELIVNSYKFRLIQLCKTHLKDGYITEPDFEQITEMYRLYHGLGGNGQAQEYYEKVIKLEMR